MPAEPEDGPRPVPAGIRTGAGGRRLAACRRPVIAAFILLVAGCVGACGPASDRDPAPVESGDDLETEPTESADPDREGGPPVEPTAAEPEAARSEPVEAPRAPSGEAPTVSAPTVRPLDRDPLLRVGVLLPLSGSRAETGRELFRAIEMALFDADSDRIELLPRDTAGDAGTARSAFLELVGDGVGLVIGPLFAWTTEAVVPAGAEHGVPILALSNDVSVADRDAWMLGVHPRGEVRRILRHAAAAPDRRIGLIAPASEYGDEVAEAYRLHVARENQSEVLRYTEDSEPGAVAQQFVDAVPGTASRAGISILIAARGHTLRSLAAELAYRSADPDRVRYLGLSGWRTSDLGGEPALEGGRFADLPEDRFREFAERFRRLHDVPPSRTAALAYDATALAAHLAAAEPGARRARLLAPGGFRGLLGAFRLLPGGTVERRFGVYEIRRGRPSLLEPAPAEFARTPSG